MMSEKFDNYQTSLAEDRHILSSKELSTNERNCVLLRINEKEIVNFIMKSSFFFLQVLDLPFAEFFVQKNNAPSDLDSAKEYFIDLMNIYPEGKEIFNKIKK